MYTPSLQTATDVETIKAIMAQIPIGGTITYETISETLGYQITQNRRFLIIKAIDALSNEQGAIFASVRGVGYKRLPAEDAHMIGKNARSRIRSAAKRSAKTIASAISKTNDMSPASRLKANQELTVLGLIEYATTDRATSKLKTEEKPLPTGKVLSALLNQLNSND